MRKAVIVGGFAFALTSVASFAGGGAKMKITSSGFQQGGNIPSKLHVMAGVPARRYRSRMFRPGRKALS